VGCATFVEAPCEMPPVPPERFPLPPVASRFVRYVRVDTQADAGSHSVPTSAGQLELARMLEGELADLGLEAEMTPQGYVYARVPPRDASGAPRLGLVAHVDTSPDEPGGPVRPLIHPAYDGSVIQLPGDPSVTLDPARQPALAEHVGHDLISSDGTTLLGSDDKAGVAIIMQSIEEILRSDTPRPELCVLFTVDEEVGRGVDHVDLERFGAEVAYTVDGGGVGGIYAETFNASEAVVTVRGVSVHPGYAYGVLVNAVSIIAEIVAGLPRDEAPDTTRHREGYFFPHTISHGDVSRASVQILLRDFEEAGLARRKTLVTRLARQAMRRHPGASIDVEFRDSYRNMRTYIAERDERVVSFAMEVARQQGIRADLRIVRGGTDGARLSELGIPTPNLFTGGHDFHSRFEWNTVQNLETAQRYLVSLIAHWAAHCGRPTT
jgi:tripeptide aminopeptidase